MLTRGCERPGSITVDDGNSPHLVSSRSLTDSFQYQRLSSMDSNSNGDDNSFHAINPGCEKNKALDHVDTSNIQSPIIFRNMSCEETYQSAFTPIRKRNRTPDVSPVFSLRKSLHYDSSTESSPFISRNTSSLLDEYEVIPLTTSEDLVVLDDCPSISTMYEKEFITLKHVGEGNFFAVDIVLCKKLNCPYAIKRTKNPMLQSSERKRYLKEINLFSEVKECPNLMKYYKSWQDDRCLYTLMECCSRGNLTQFIHQPDSIPESFIWYVAYSVLMALEYLHSHDIVHLDIKPENILFTELGYIRVGDLGCASHTNEGCSSVDLRYMSFEGLEDDASPSRDVFSLGLVLYQLMTKEELPISGDRWSQLRKGGITSIKEYSTELNSLVHEMTSETNRPNASELIELVPQQYINNSSDIRSYVRSMTVSFLAASKRRKQANLKLDNVINGEDEIDRSEFSTPIDVIKNSYSMTFSF